MGMTEDFETSLQVLRGFDTDISVEVNEIKVLNTDLSCIFLKYVKEIVLFASIFVSLVTSHHRYFNTRIFIKLKTFSLCYVLCRGLWHHLAEELPFGLQISKEGDTGSL